MYSVLLTSLSHNLCQNLLTYHLTMHSIILFLLNLFRFHLKVLLITSALLLRATISKFPLIPTDKAKRRNKPNAKRKHKKTNHPMKRSRKSRRGAENLRKTKTTRNFLKLGKHKWKIHHRNTSIPVMTNLPFITRNLSLSSMSWMFVLLLPKWTWSIKEVKKLL